MDSQEIWLAANQMINFFGDGAAVQASMRADVSRHQGDEEGHATWMKIHAAIVQLMGAPLPRYAGEFDGAVVQP
jgi:hypothetical protein